MAEELPEHLAVLAAMRRSDPCLRSKPSYRWDCLLWAFQQLSKDAERIG
jgi:hypothetical protein